MKRVSVKKLSLVLSASLLTAHGLVGCVDDGDPAPPLLGDPGVPIETAGTATTAGTGAMAGSAGMAGTAGMAGMDSGAPSTAGTSFTDAGDVATDAGDAG